VPYLDEVSWQYTGGKMQYAEFIKEHHVWTQQGAKNHAKYGLDKAPVAGKDRVDVGKLAENSLDANTLCREGELKAVEALERGPWSALQWLGANTLGLTAANLELRRTELAILGLPSSDIDVVRSYRTLVEPGDQAQALRPWTLEYMRAAKIILIIGDSVFLHGGFKSEHLLRLPSEEIRDGSLARQPPTLRLPDSTSLEQWAAELNAWKTRQLRLFETFPRWKSLVSDGPATVGSERWRGGQPLMMPALTGCHLMTDGMFVKGNPHPLEDDVATYLIRNGIRRVFVGHQPAGWSPAITRRVPERITVVNGDTSFSDVKCDKSRNAADMRGIAFSRIVITREKTAVSGQLPDGTPHGFGLHVDWAKDSPTAALVGCQFDDESWGRTVVAGQLQTFHAEGFNLRHNKRDGTEAKAHVSEAYKPHL